MTSQQWSMTVTPVVAALTTLCAATAMSGVIEGLRWMGYAGVAVIVVTATGLGLRAIRTPVLVVGLTQMFAVLCLLVALFTNSGILGMLPGPAAISELGDVLGRSVEVVRTGVPPVDATAPVLCLVVVAIGLVAVLVDTLAVAAGTPAACGLVLLCVYAVPASLSNSMLPWWSFVLGASSFALLLAVDGAHRHQQWRNRPALPGTNGSVGSPVAQVSTAVVLALLVGSTFTLVGTVGQFPLGAPSGSNGGLGLQPFTKLRGMLDQGTNRELFRVHGLGQDTRYLRMITLSQFNDNGGWSLPEGLPSGDLVGRRNLRTPPGTRPPGPTTRIDIEPLNYEDNFIGVYGTPVRISGLASGTHYDSGSGMVFTENRRRQPRITEDVDLSQPSADQLRAAGANYDEIDKKYLNSEGIKPSVRQLARELTQSYSNPFDKARALERYLRDTDFTYSLETGQGSDEDALEDFLFRSKKGFCEQYASALALLARAAGLPSRVAIGYTAGYLAGDYRSISTQDAHAWVEMYFPGQGWTQFDATPLPDGRTYTPPYAVENGSAADPNDDTATESSQPAGSAATAAPTNPNDKTDPGAGQAGDAPQGEQAASWIGWTAGAVALVAVLITVLAALIAGGPTAARRRRLLVPIAAVCWLLTVVLAAALVSWWLSVLIVVLTVAAAPGFVREWRRRARRHTVHNGDAAAASAAWAELLAESQDRGAEMVDAETVRMTARRLAREHDLDEDGKSALRTVVGAVERSWYSTRTDPDPALARAFDELVAGLRRAAPLDLRSRLLPRSVLHPPRKPKQDPDPPVQPPD
jgi:transglutaminase-like putative cysteine protease